MYVNDSLQSKYLRVFWQQKCQSIQLVCELLKAGVGSMFLASLGK